jgi:predicted TIM-barrel fold metal-dependent hydrolase
MFLDYTIVMMASVMPCQTNMDLLQSTFKAVHAETQVMYASDWPHWDFDVPGRIAGLPLFRDQARCTIPGETARKLFKL